MRKFVVNGKVAADDDTIYVIAEIGHNHQGKLAVAREMFLRAHECGVHAVKLQKRDNKALFCKSLYDSPYTSENAYGATYGEHREALEFGEAEFAELAPYAAELGMDFACTAFDISSANFLGKVGASVIKIASGDLVNTPLLRHVAKMGKPMVLSTGGGTLDDVARAYDAIMPLNTNLCILQCTASYPCEAPDMNLRVIETYRDRFPDVVIGLSDHQNGISLSMVAYALGARVFEKHFTLNRAWRGTDHAFSIEPTGMRKLVRDLSRAVQAMGSPVKHCLPIEEKPLLKMRKKIVAARDLPAGTVLTQADLALRCPGDGLLPYLLDSVLGKTLAVPLAADAPLALEMLR